VAAKRRVFVDQKLLSHRLVTQIRGRKGEIEELEQYKTCVFVERAAAAERLGEPHCSTGDVVGLHWESMTGQIFVEERQNKQVMEDAVWMTD
jgi:hypothetical protein